MNWGYVKKNGIGNGILINKTMKPFNLEEAKAGKPVCNREGNDVRIICFDKMYCFIKRTLMMKMS